MLIKVTEHFWLNFDLLSRVIVNTKTIDGECCIYNVSYNLINENVSYTIYDPIFIQEFLRKLEWNFNNGEISNVSIEKIKNES